MHTSKIRQTDKQTLPKMKKIIFSKVDRQVEVFKQHISFTMGTTTKTDNFQVIRMKIDFVLFKSRVLCMSQQLL